MKKLFALTLSLICSAQLWAKDYQVADFGVMADGTTLNTRAIQRAIDLIHEQGGGRLIFPLGRYLSGTLHLRSGVTLHLENGAVLMGSNNPYDYDRVPNLNTAFLLAVGQEVAVSPYADLKREIKGRITAINPTIDDNGQVQVDATITNDGTLTDGMNVKVFIRQAIGEQLVVPKSAVVIRDNLEVLFRYVDGKAVWTYVHTSLANSREYVVEANTERGADLNEGDLIITSGNLNLADGSEVIIATE